MIRKIQDIDVNNKVVLLRVDFNVPVKKGIILDDSRIKKSLATINYLIKRNAKIVLVSHFARPNGKINADMSLRFIADYLMKITGYNVDFMEDSISDQRSEKIANMKTKEIILLENLRFHPGEESGDHEFAKKLAKNIDIFVNDAFSCCHRAHASISTITEFLPSVAGLLLQDEIENLESKLNDPSKEMGVIIGGSKISSKINLILNLIKKSRFIAIGGAMVNSFFKAKNINIQNSYIEPNSNQKAIEILQEAQKYPCKIIIPCDVNTGLSLNDKKALTSSIYEIADNSMVLDIGPKTIIEFKSCIDKVKTLIWNGPLGAYENKAFALGTEKIAQYIAKKTENAQIISVAGGGDIVAALSAKGLEKKFSYVSTAGGAFLEWLEGKKLPGIDCLYD